MNEHTVYTEHIRNNYFHAKNTVDLQKQLLEIIEMNNPKRKPIMCMNNCRFLNGKLYMNARGRSLGKICHAQLTGIIVSSCFIENLFTIFRDFCFIANYSEFKV